MGASPGSSRTSDDPKRDTSSPANEIACHLSRPADGGRSGGVAPVGSGTDRRPDRRTPHHQSAHGQHPPEDELWENPGLLAQCCRTLCDWTTFDLTRYPAPSMLPDR